MTLTESLALRLTATVVEARWQAGEVDGASVGEVVSVAATLRPSLGLYLAF